jgi:hypothetical protein
VQIGGKGTINLPAGSSFDCFSSSSLSGSGESRSMESAIASASRASASAVLAGSSVVDLRAVEVFPPDPLVSRSIYQG